MKEREGFTERELLGFARSYLSDAFPNPERTGCPPDYAIRRLAHQPLEGDLVLTDHLTCCSPCFKAYMQHLGEFKAELHQAQRARRAIWIMGPAAAVATAAILIVALYLFLPRHHDERIVAPHTPAVTTPGSAPQPPVFATYIPVVIDLRHAAPERGPQVRKPSGARQIIPANSLVDLTLWLPVGSENGRYSITLTSNGKNVWSGSAKASHDKDQMALRTRADFSQIPAGGYDLEVSRAGMRLRVPLALK